ncbi:hypothetical protein [Embleya sp. NPDC050493]|uniref:hypothetical protein n=1 Tax=Embleya sp. NPDC050493 TaxID=3363989 RepID=UPI00379578FA
MNRNRTVRPRTASLLLLVAIALLAGGLILYWAPWQGPEKDPRAERGSDPNTSLKQALERTGVTLPPDAADIHYFWAGNPMGEGLDITYHATCAGIPELLRQTGLPAELRPGYTPEHMSPFTATHRWPHGVPTRGVTEARFGDYIKEVAAAELGDGNCAIFLHWFLG